MQLPRLHTWLAKHGWHRLPPTPQAACVKPVWQAPAVSQQPVHEVGPHGGFALPQDRPMPVPTATARRKAKVVGFITARHSTRVEK